MDSLDTELDRLFRLPPSELVGERNALADRLRKAGDRASSERVKALKRPAPAAWALNQVFFRQPALIEAARHAAEELRVLQARDGIDAPQLSAALAAQRAGAHAVVDAALRCCAQAGLADGQVVQRKIFATLQAWLSGSGDEPPGRMQRELEPSGFDAITAVGNVQQVPLSLPSAPAEPAPAAPKADPRRVARALARLAEAERSVQAARERARLRGAERRELEDALVRAHHQLREAELSKHGAAVEETARELTKAEVALADARAELASAQAPD